MQAQLIEKMRSLRLNGMATGASQRLPDRTGDAPPGNTVIWRGISRLTDIEIGFLMGAEIVGN